jgi:hypothetical protein
MEDIDLNENAQQFIIQLFEQTRGDQSAQVSMYDIGSLLGLERDAASRVAEELIGLQLAEIRTLSGGIGISFAGSELVQGIIGPRVSDTGGATRLADERQLNADGRQAVEQIVTAIKNQTGTLGLDFDTLAELMADLKSIDAQLGSSRPKTAIVRECLHSIAGVLKSTANNNGLHSRVNGLVGD